ncbi:hypothetical protein [Brevibacterium oceani]|uniref:hypothetical protein n=1 Tax=Brevibacterium oceani TaxID=358099 RepID=UPI001B327C6F|nr:hypothetical protein [Brevibacterium oceani]
MAIVEGGSTVYGDAVGFLMLETQFPRIRGDVGNYATWDFPAIYEIVPKALPSGVIGVDVSEELVDAFLTGGRNLVRKGARIIGTSCGYLAAIQPILAEELGVPVVASSLVQVPLVSSIVGRDAAIGILTERPQLDDSHFTAAGWSPGDFDIRIGSFREDSYFPQVFIDNSPTADVDRLNSEIHLAVEDLVSEHPDVRALVFECTNFVPFSKSLRERFGLPVFDYHTAITAAHNAVVGPSFAPKL